MYKVEYPRIIAVDFDGTLCTNKYPEIGEPNNQLIEILKAQKKHGNKLILWTCRVGELLENAVKWCEERDLYFDAVNENLPETIKHFGADSRKVYANQYIDDKNTIYNHEITYLGTKYKPLKNAFRRLFKSKGAENES